MRSLTKKMHKGQKGLTLIELLIVVAILGIIAAVVIPNLGGFMVTGRISAANTEAENVKTAALAYYAENEDWPQAGQDSSVLSPRWLAGNTTADYTFCPDYGWLVGTARNDWAGISFTGGVVGENGNHGTWTRNP